MVPLTALPLHRRPRERLWEEGAEHLSLRELLMVILGSGQGSCSVTEVADTVAQALLQGNPTLEQLGRIRGVGRAKAGSIMAALQLSQTVAQNNSSLLMRQPSQVAAACHDLLSYPQEHLVVFFLTCRHAQIRRETVTVGTATASLIHPREIFRSAIIENASHIILAHNHPSGDASPSEADCQATRMVAQAGRQLDIALLDHVIVSTRGFTSLKMDQPQLFCYT